MADLNALIAQGVQFQAPPNPFAQYAQMQQLQQGEQANQMNQMKMDEARAAAVERNALRQLNPSDPGYEAQLSKLNPSLGIAYRKEQNAASSAQTKLIADKLALLPEAYRMADTPEAYKTLHETVHSDPVLGPWLDSVGATKEKGLAKLNDAVSTGNFDKLRVASMQSVNQILESMKPLIVAPSASAYDPTTGTFKQAPAAPEKEVTPEITNMKALGYPLTTEGFRAYREAQRQERLLTPEEEAQKLRIAAASRAPAQPRPEQPPVAVVDPVTGKQVFVSREEALKGRMTPATAMEGLTPKEIQTREAKYPQATLAVKTFETKADKLAEDLKTLANHPGLSGISGLIYGRTPAVTGAARQAQTLYDSIVARGGFSELQAMRSASPTGGALGNVSEREGQYLRDAFAAIGRTQDTPDLKKSLLGASAATIAAKQNTRDAYDMTYDYKTGAKPAAAAAAPGAKPTVSNW